jgi:hypothetical protein
MKGYRVSLAYVLLAACWPSLAIGQAFQNLDFETVTFSQQPNPNEHYAALATLPGWTFHQRATNQLNLEPHLGGNPQTFLITDNFGYAETPPWPHLPPAQGHYSIYLQEGINSPDPTQIGPAVSQTGLIPEGSSSVRFYGGGGVWAGGENLWIVSINSVPVPTKRFVIGEFLGHPVYSSTVAADVSSFAGSVVTLTIAIDPTHDLASMNPQQSHDTGGVLDDVRFSTLDYTIIPEPAGIVLVLVSLGLAAVMRWRGV